MVQRLPIGISQVKAGNTCENVLSKINQLIYSLCQSKETTDKAYNNLMNSVKYQQKNGNYIYKFYKQ